MNMLSRLEKIMEQKILIYKAGYYAKIITRSKMRYESYTVEYYAESLVQLQAIEAFCRLFSYSDAKNALCNLPRSKATLTHLRPIINTFLENHPIIMEIMYKAYPGVSHEDWNDNTFFVMDYLKDKLGFQETDNDYAFSRYLESFSAFYVAEDIYATSILVNMEVVDNE